MIGGHSSIVRQVLGTSARAPIFASNLARCAALGRPRLWCLYANPQAFSDITPGSNPGCGARDEQRAWNPDSSLFNSRYQWVPFDQVTGLGTPIFETLAAAACG